MAFGHRVHRPGTSRWTASAAHTLPPACTHLAPRKAESARFLRRLRGALRPPIEYRRSKATAVGEPLHGSPARWWQVGAVGGVGAGGAAGRGQRLHRCPPLSTACAHARPQADRPRARPRLGGAGYPQSLANNYRSTYRSFYIQDLGEWRFHAQRCG